MSSPSHLYTPVDRVSWNNMADAPERYYPPSDLEPVHGYYSPQAKSDSAPQVAYAYNDVSGKEAVATSTVLDGDLEGEKKSNWRDKRLCGLPILTALVVGLVIIAAVVGGVVGGVVGSKTGKSNVTESDSAVAEEDKATSSGINLPEPTTRASNGISSTSTSSSARPSRTQACPEFQVDVRSDYWHTVTNYYQNPIQFMQGAYNKADNNSVIKMVAYDSSTSSSSQITKLEWQFLKIKEPHPLAKLGCETEELQTTIYKIACRSTEPNVNIRLGLDPVSWDRYTEGRNSTGELVRLRLTEDDNSDLSQLWYTKKTSGGGDYDGEDGETYYEWIEIYNYLSGEQWRLATRASDAQAFMWSGVVDEMTRWHRNTTRLIASPWFGY